MNDLQILQHVINGVEIEILNYQSDYVGIQRAKANGHYYLNDVLYITYEGGATGKSLKECKLILKPLRDLRVTRELFGEYNFEYPDEFFNEIEDGALEYKYLKELLKHHYDVFGLNKKINNDIYI